LVNPILSSFLLKLVHFWHVHMIWHWLFDSLQTLFDFLVDLSNHFLQQVN